MIKERYCSKEVSELLIAKGLKGEYHAYYNVDGDISQNRSYLYGEVPAVTYQMACEWLREEEHLHVEIYANASGYRFIISKPGGDGTDLVIDIEGDNDGGAWDDYYDCAEAAIKYCLKSNLM